MFALLWPFLIYWLVFFVACYVVTEVAQDQLYDEVTPRVALKVGLASLIVAALATWVRPSFETLFTANIGWTVLQAIVWFAVFTLILQFHPPHALGLGLITMVLVSGVATMGVQSMTQSTRDIAPAMSRPSNVPIRRSLTPTPAAPKAETPKK